MKLIVNGSSMVPIYEQIVDQIKAMIVSGELKPDDILPSVRSLSRDLKISALTVKKAYDTLEAEGFTVSSARQGHVCDARPIRRSLMEEQRRDVEADLEMAIQKGRRCGFEG